jgi:hypothetical protein
MWFLHLTIQAERDVLLPGPLIMLCADGSRISVQRCSLTSHGGFGRHWRNALSTQTCAERWVSHSVVHTAYMCRFIGRPAQVPYRFAKASAQGQANGRPRTTSLSFCANIVLAPLQGFCSRCSLPCEKKQRSACLRLELVLEGLFVCLRASGCSLAR